MNLAEDRIPVYFYVSKAFVGRTVAIDSGELNGNETMIVFKFYADLYTRPRRPYFRSWPRERGCGIMKTREEEPHADSLLYSLQLNSRDYNSIF